MFMCFKMKLFFNILFFVSILTTSLVSSNMELNINKKSSTNLIVKKLVEALNSETIPKEIITFGILKYLSYKDIYNFML